MIMTTNGMLRLEESEHSIVREWEAEANAELERWFDQAMEAVDLIGEISDYTGE